MNEFGHEFGHKIFGSSDTDSDIDSDKVMTSNTDMFENLGLGHPQTHLCTRVWAKSLK